MEIKVPKVSWALHATAKSIWTVCVKTEMSKDLLLQCDWSDIHMPLEDINVQPSAMHTTQRRLTAQMSNSDWRNSRHTANNYRTNPKRYN